ncbi:flap endonuclease Xni [Colwellia psychrerythraea]|uniref:Flap endonuclease Xni n=1 Tax=Colwellia psychrerythraea TaxID=28229 RepID=A0A099L136_COLPS|nr:flap endonuclease Xni [Colwellia psychrerythraea]KGJ96130.1 putative exonuclease xni [Colwellia psychrerythraea]
MSAHLILIDALNLIRRVYAVQERPFIQIKQQHDDELSSSTLKQVLFNTQKTCVNALIKIIDQHQPTHALAVFDSQQPCWRYQLFDGYKKGRKKMPDHLANKLTDIQDAFMEQGFDSLTSDEDEADDLIATLAVKMALHGQKVTIISTDKGFLPLLSPNIHLYDYFNRRYLDEEHVKNKFNVKSTQLIDFWTLTGDNTNKIEGVSGIGQVTAAKLLNQYGSLKAVLNATDLKDSLAEKLALSVEQMDLARKLLTLKQDIPLGFNLKDIRLTSPSPALEISGNIIAINGDRN